MRAALLLIPLVLFSSCGEQAPEGPRVSREPISVRGWIASIDTGQTSEVFRTVETEAAKRAQDFQSTNVWVENAPFVSGGIAEDGAFVLLDVPPGSSRVEFSAPGVERSLLTIENVPPHADVLIPGLVIRAGAVVIADPKKIEIRLPASVQKPEATAMKAKIAGLDVPVTRVPIAAMVDRRDYPVTPGLGAPVATVK